MVKEQQIQHQVELVVVELLLVQEHLDLELQEQITLVVVVAVEEHVDQEQVEQEDRVS